ncbi:MAG: hypothetical protein HPY50_01555 [Firmicutes bacterium]|nr:hypothetical protein [Bacillota bacterium]
MITGERKPLREILGMLEGHRRLLVLGCRGCVTVCLAGGDRQVAETAAALRAADARVSVLEHSLERQCEYEMVDTLWSLHGQIDAVLSLACGIGVQAVAERFPDLPVFPGVNTSFLGLPVKAGTWEERCQACGDCLLDRTGGICPVSRCAKSLMNGPCGGSQNGLCEIGRDTPCAWALIHERLAGRGQLHLLEAYRPPKNWGTSRDGGPRRLVHEDWREVDVD